MVTPAASQCRVTLFLAVCEKLQILLKLTFSKWVLGWVKQQKVLRKKNTKRGQSGLVKKKNTFSQPPLHLPVCCLYTYPPGEDLNRLHLGGLGEAGVGSVQGSVSHLAGCIHSHGGWCDHLLCCIKRRLIALETDPNLIWSNKNTV